MYVVVNAAMSADGKLASRRREQLAISGPEDFDRVDALRANSDAVMVGIGTVMADDPNLTVDDADLIVDREGRGEPPQPFRVVIDSRARTPVGARVLDGAAPTYVFVSESARPERVAALDEAGATVVVVGSDRVDLPRALERLEDDGIGRLMVEGGGELIFSLFRETLIDELSVYVSPMVIGGREAPTLADGEGFIDGFPRLTLEGVERLGDGALLVYRWD